MGVSNKVKAAVWVLSMGWGSAGAAVNIYTDEGAFLSALSSLGFGALHEGFEDGAAWAASRNSIPAPGSTPSVISRGISWSANHAANEVATGDVGGSAPDGTFAIYSLPHGLTTDSGLYCDGAEDPNIPSECYQNDGLMIESESGEILYGIGGRFDSNGKSGKVTFLLDGVDVNGNDTDNVGNVQREGDVFDNWNFVGVIDSDGFTTAEVRELRGKDFDQVLLFADDFTIGVTAVPVPPALPLLFSGLGVLAAIRGRRFPIRRA